MAGFCVDLVPDALTRHIIEPTAKTQLEFLEHHAAMPGIKSHLLFVHGGTGRTTALLLYPYNNGGVLFVIGRMV